METVVRASALLAVRAEPAARIAELARGDALNEHYGLGAYAASGDISAVTTSAPQRVVSVAADGFDWGAAGIGAWAAIGLALLATGMVVIVRQTRRSQLSTPN